MPNPTKKELEAQAGELAQKISNFLNGGSKAKKILFGDPEAQPISDKEILKAEIQILKLQLAKIEAKIHDKV